MAVATLETSRNWTVRLLAIELTESVRSFQVPATPLTSACPPSRPSVPTSRATRVTSAAKEESWSTIVLMVSLSWRISPLTSTVIFLVMSPLATAVVTSAMLRTWAVRLDAMELIDHRVECVFELQDFTFDIHGDLLGEVTIGDSSRDFGDVADLRGEVARH